MIAYHGTYIENVQSILDHGFKPETWFAMEEFAARIYGGPFIFSVEFSDDPSMWHGEPWPDNWQFHISDWHDVKYIMDLKLRLL